MPRFLLKTGQKPPALCHLANRQAVITLTFLFAICSGDAYGQGATQVSVAGPSAVRLGSNAQYTASAGAATAPVVWSVNGVAGGNNSTGAISPGGLYSPAPTIFAGHSVTITATIEPAPASSASLRVRVLNPLPVFASGTATQRARGSLLLDIRGSGFVSGSQLQIAGANAATTLISATELQGTISLSSVATAVTVGIFNPDALQKSPITITLPVQAGAGSVPTLTVSSTSVPFGNVAVNTPSTQPVVLTSTGNTPVIIQSASLSGAGFTISGATFPVTLNPGLALTLDVQFDPATAGVSTGTLTIQSNSSANGTAVVSLSATGVAHHVNLSWEAPGSSSVSIVSYKIYRIASGGAAYQLLSTSSGSESSYVDSAVQPGATYDYIVTSLDSAGVESAPSNTVSATIP